MDLRRMKRPSPAMVVATAALFFALGGTAGAIVTAAVPLAKRALVADKAKVATTAKTANLAKVANIAKVANTAKTATRATTANTANTATSATTATTAGNANQLGGSTKEQVIAAASAAGASAALATSPGGARPASTAAALVSVETEPFALGPDELDAFDVACDAGQKALGGGFSSFGLVTELGSFPSTDGTTWNFFLANLAELDPVNGDIYVTCLR
jgi:hypothetical protein